jgi:hypothetical protein
LEKPCFERDLFWKGLKRQRGERTHRGVRVLKDICIVPIFNEKADL